jgi:hypothetical protein
MMMPLPEIDSRPEPRGAVQIILTSAARTSAAAAVISPGDVLAGVVVLGAAAGSDFFAAGADVFIDGVVGGVEVGSSAVCGRVELATTARPVELATEDVATMVVLGA